jgi:hypothetical protein
VNACHFVPVVTGSGVPFASKSYRVAVHGEVASRRENGMNRRDSSKAYRSKLRAICVVIVASFISSPAKSDGSLPEKYPVTKHPHESNIHLLPSRKPYSFPDCNGNAVPDSVDIAEGTEDDVNHNGILDDCDPDTNLCVRYNRNNCRDGWKGLANSPDTSYFHVAHAGNGTVIIQYTVPPGKHLIRLEAIPTDGYGATVIKTLSQSSGPYSFPWDKCDPMTHVKLPNGLYTIRLTVNDHTYDKQVRWNNR